MLEYAVSKDKGSNRYYVCRVGAEKVPLTPRYPSKKKALHKAAEMEGLEYKEYMSLRRKENANND